MSVFQKCNYCSASKFSGLSSTLGKELSDNNFPYKLSDFETLNHKQYSCDNCGSSDRDRLYKLFLEQYSWGSNKTKLLDFAPSANFSSFLKSNSNFIYKSADLYMEDVDDKVDITDMRIYKNNSFDIIICSHILEHVNDDVAALKEIRRVMTNKGIALIMTPIINKKGIFDEDTSITDKPERIKRFAQDDHVRLYEKKVFLSRVKESGLKTREYTVKDFGRINFYKNAISPKSILYIMSK